MAARKNHFVKELEEQSRENLKKPAKRKFFAGKIIVALFFIFCFISGVLAFKILNAPEDEKEGGIFTQIKHLVTSPNRTIQGEAQDRVNIVLLGIGGGEHEGPLLTDTIILVSIQPSTHKVAMISIPRDLLVEIPGIRQEKINHAYALIEAANPGEGGKKVARILENIFSIPIHYYFRIDFEGFIKVIDELGGISVNVEHTLDDPSYPVAGKENATSSERYEHLIIEKGIRYMNGDTALKYVRSRKAIGAEGSDFARSRRQQKILIAIKDKILAPSTIFNLNKVNHVFDAVVQNTDTSLEFWEILRLYDMSKEISSSNIMNVVLDDGPTGPLVDATVNSAFVLIPKKGDWSDFTYIAENVFDQSAISNFIAQEPIEPKLEPTRKEEDDKKLEKQKKSVRIEVQNGTKIIGLAKKTADYLASKGYQVIKFGNAPVQTYKKSILYDLAPQDTAKKELLKELEILFLAVVFDSGKPTGVMGADGAKIDYPVSPQAQVLLVIGDEWGKIIQKLLATP